MMSPYSPVASQPARNIPGRARAIVVMVVALVILTVASASFTLSMQHLRQIRYPQPKVTISQGTNANIPVNQAFTFGVKRLAGVKLSYKWDFGDGSGTTTTSAATVQHTFATDGSYTVAVTSSDAIGQTTTSSTSVTVLPPAPVAAFTVALTPYYGEVCADFDASTSTGEQLTYSWDYGDGNSSSPSQSPQSQECYYQVGAFVVTLTVTDKASQTSTVTHSVQIG